MVFGTGTTRQSSTRVFVHILTEKKVFERAGGLDQRTVCCCFCSKFYKNKNSIFFRTFLVLNYSFVVNGYEN